MKSYLIQSLKNRTIITITFTKLRWNSSKNPKKAKWKQNLSSNAFASRNSYPKRGSHAMHFGEWRLQLTRTPRWTALSSPTTAFTSSHSSGSSKLQSSSISMRWGRTWEGCFRPLCWFTSSAAPPIETRTNPRKTINTNQRSSPNTHPHSYKISISLKMIHNDSFPTDVLILSKST